MNAPSMLAEITTVGAQGTELPHESATLHVTGEAVYTDDIPSCAARCTRAGHLASRARRTGRRGHRPRRAAGAVRRGGRPHRQGHPGREQLRPDPAGRPLSRRRRSAVSRPAGGGGGGARDALCARGREEGPCQGVRAAGGADDRRGARQAQLRAADQDARARRRGAAIAAAPHRLQGRVHCGQQEQLYLEGQITYAVPREDGQLTLYVSTQHPTATSARPRRHSSSARTTSR